jgi:hypothetical protein
MFFADLEAENCFPRHALLSTLMRLLVPLDAYLRRRSVHRSSVPTFRVAGVVPLQ